MSRTLFVLGQFLAFCIIGNILFLLGLGIMFRETQFGENVKEFFLFLKEERLTGTLFVLLSHVGLGWSFSGMSRFKKSRSFLKKGRSREGVLVSVSL